MFNQQSQPTFAFSTPPASSTQSSSSTSTSPTLSKTVFDSGTALLAFVLAFYALAIRERKTPYAANSIYSTALFILLALFLALSSSIGKFIPQISGWIAALDIAAGALLVIGTIWVVYSLSWMNSRLCVVSVRLARTRCTVPGTSAAIG
jgi:hypothetical protein